MRAQWRRFVQRPAGSRRGRIFLFALPRIARLKQTKNPSAHRPDPSATSLVVGVIEADRPDRALPAELGKCGTAPSL